MTTASGVFRHLLEKVIDWYPIAAYLTLMKIRQKWISTALLAVATLSTSSAEPFAKTKFEDACTAATNDDKIVLIDFYTTWCGPCKLLDQKTWKDPEVIKLLESKTVSLKIDAEKETELAGRYRIDVYPTVLLKYVRSK